MVIERVPSDEIEDIVGMERHPILHWGRADNDTHTFYILHSKLCLNSYEDLRECPYSRAMVKGINLDLTDTDAPQFVTIGNDGRLAAL